jgi:hypothetical protein
MLFAGTALLAGFGEERRETGGEQKSLEFVSSRAKAH